VAVVLVVVTQVEAVVLVQFYMVLVFHMNQELMQLS
jgi:hypothetical protein